MSEWLLIYDPQPQPGSWNMAVDEYLFRLAQIREDTFLRFYTWLRPTASLGCGQDLSKVLNLEECQKRGVEVVRRMTGGKLVLHHLEVTYSVASSRSEVFTATLEGSYRLISEALIRGLRLMDLPASLASSTPSGYARSHLPCFAYPARNEVEIKGKKVIGSAQKRQGVTFLQHGSIPLIKEFELLAAISYGLDQNRQGKITSLSDELGRLIGYQEAVDYFIRGFEDYFKVKLKVYEFSPEEIEIIRKIDQAKYASWQWTGERIDPGQV
ncbi:MAG: lipoate--protein ligase family protein [Candidatus Saccharicenans sp.]